MANIHRLSELVANQIAAGEVVERPSSAAKELVENAIDAGARRIEVVVGNAGRSLRVSDDGVGMSAQDAPLAFERFSTSKIQRAEDLFRLQTMGFRGEALASIAAVSRVELTTRRPADPVGTSVRLGGGFPVDIRPCGCPEGTTVALEDLFFNTPARLKFLKTPSTEIARIVEALTALALAHPEIDFICKLGVRTVLDTTGARSLGDVAALVLGSEIGPQLLRATAGSPAGKLEGYVAPPELIRGDRSKQWIFMNGRPIRHPALARALDEAYGGHIPQSRHPIYIISIALDPERVDFNVHPTKKEVRLADSSLLFSLVREAVGFAVRQGGRSYAIAPELRPSFRGQRASSLRPPVIEDNHSTPISFASPRQDVALASASISRQNFEVSGLGDSASRSFVPPRHVGREFPWDQLRLLGQIHETYVVLEHPDGLYVLDQHNSHERYLYEQLGPGQVSSQELLIPTPLALTLEPATALEEHREALDRMGFTVAKPVAPGEYWHLMAVPATLGSTEAKLTLISILNDIVEGEELPKTDFSEKWRVMVACHSAIKAGDRLSQNAMELLIAQWRTCEQPFTCPHGRPTAILIPLNELHRRCLRGMQTR